jgi:hypothetical protein
MAARRLLAVTLLCVVAAANAAAQDIAAQDVPKTPADVSPRIEALASPVTVRLRGLSAVDENIAWASGREGTVIRTIDAGKTWSVFKVPGAEKLDFRDVEGFSADEAVILSIGPGEDSRVYRTADGGDSWTLVLQNTNPNAFFDCFSFDGAEGRLLGDPVDGRFEVLRTSDAGKSWMTMEGPVAESGESAFAASGTCILRRAHFTIVASGGSSPRGHWYVDAPADDKKPASWAISKPSEAAIAPSAGYFSVAWGALGVVMVGGDYKLESAEGIAQKLDIGHVTYLVDSGGTTAARSYRDENKEVYVPAQKHKKIVGSAFLQSSAIPNPRGYRSGMACSDSEPVCVAAGPGGADSWDGKNWKPLGGDGYDSVDSAGRVFWFSGDGGRVGRLVLPDRVSP